MPDPEMMYQALVDKNSAFEGVFVAAIHSTGIFCRPTCHARKPKLENVEFYPNAKAALSAGFRPCKLCHPMDRLGATPEWIQPLFEALKREPEAQFRAEDLRRRGLDPARVRRWFQKHHGMSFATYQRLMRINRAYRQIRHSGCTVAAAATQSGYESLSGFGEGFRKVHGFSPQASTKLDFIAISRLSTPLGPMLAGAVDEGICLLEFTDRRMLETQLSRLTKRMKLQTASAGHPHFERLSDELREYFAGERRNFQVPMLTPGTEFQNRVWSALAHIPYGETRSYSEQAQAIESPQAVRAVARANGDNRLAILIPCHRVVGADGKLTGYGGGLWRKEKLLALEAQTRQASDA